MATELPAPSALPSQAVKTSKLISSEPGVMGGLPCFTGTRVPIAFVLASLDEGDSLERLQVAYPFLTQAHVAAARDFAAANPIERPHSAARSRLGWRLIARRIVRPGRGTS
jgi:uncharacterized protein (DUF433 family)